MADPLSAPVSAAHWLTSTSSALPSSTAGRRQLSVSGPSGSPVAARAYSQQAQQQFHQRLLLGDELLAQLGHPLTAYDALRQPPGTGPLRAALDAAAPDDHEFALRAARAGKSIFEWLEELRGWSWPRSRGTRTGGAVVVGGQAAQGNSAGFEMPTAKRRKVWKDRDDTDEDKTITMDSTTREADSAGHADDVDDGEDTDDAYMGSLRASQVAAYERRLDDISAEMEELDVEGLKRHVLHHHIMPLSRPGTPLSDRASVVSSGSFSTSASTSYTRMDDLAAIVTATVVQALPNLSRLARLMHAWSTRLLVLKSVPALLAALNEAEVAMASGRNAVDVPASPAAPRPNAKDAKNKGKSTRRRGKDDDGDGAASSSSSDSSDDYDDDAPRGLSRRDFSIMQSVLQQAVSRPGRLLDHMLDTLEGGAAGDDCLPEHWLDRMEAVEHAYAEWVADCERRVREAEWAAAATRAHRTRERARRRAEREEMRRREREDEEKRRRRMEEEQQQQRREREEEEIRKRERQEKLERDRFEQQRLDMEKLEQERLERERLEKESREKARLELQRLEQERLERERLETESREKARLDLERLEQERLEQERLEQERLEQERLEQERLKQERLKQERLEQERFEKENREKARLELERLEQERLEMENREKARLELERLERERLEQENREKARLELERLKQERLEEENREKARLELERLERERLETENREKARLELERLEQERLDQESREKARLELERLEKERLENERLEQERLETERLEKERLEKERLEKERLEAIRLEAARLEAARLEVERLDAERLEAERLEAARAEAQRLETERLEAERLEAERLEAERQEAERQEAERLEAARLEAERVEAERLEAERLEAERLEAERLEAERLEAERLKKERLENERLEKEKLEKEKLEKKKLEEEKLERQRLELEAATAAAVAAAALAAKAKAEAEAEAEAARQRDGHRQKQLPTPEPEPVRQLDMAEKDEDPTVVLSMDAPATLPVKHVAEAGHVLLEDDDAPVMAVNEEAPAAHHVPKETPVAIPTVDDPRELEPTSGDKHAELPIAAHEATSQEQEPEIAVQATDVALGKQPDAVLDQAEPLHAAAVMQLVEETPTTDLADVDGKDQLDGPINSEAPTISTKVSDTVLTEQSSGDNKQIEVVQLPSVAAEDDELPTATTPTEQTPDVTLVDRAVAVSSAGQLDEPKATLDKDIGSVVPEHDVDEIHPAEVHEAKAVAEQEPRHILDKPASPGVHASVELGHGVERETDTSEEPDIEEDWTEIQMDEVPLADALAVPTASAAPAASTEPLDHSIPLSDQVLPSIEDDSVVDTDMDLDGVSRDIRDPSEEPLDDILEDSEDGSEPELPPLRDDSDRPVSQGSSASTVVHAVRGMSSFADLSSDAPSPPSSPLLRIHTRPSLADESSPAPPEMVGSPEPMTPAPRSPMLPPRPSTPVIHHEEAGDRGTPNSPALTDVRSPSRMSELSASDAQLQQQISEILESIPAKIHLTSQPVAQPNHHQPATTGPGSTSSSSGPSFAAATTSSHNHSHSSQQQQQQQQQPAINHLNPPDLPRLQVRKKRSVVDTMRSASSLSTYSRAPTPSFTLAPAVAYSKNGSRGPRQYSAPRNPANPEIKLYHLSRDNGETIKLFIRCVGERGERVMVRVGGGWADLGEYLKEYATHHGRRPARGADDRVEVQEGQRVGSASTRSASAAGNHPFSSSTGTSSAAIAAAINAAAAAAAGRSSPAPRPASALDTASPVAAASPLLAVRKTRRSVGAEDRPPPAHANFPRTPLANNSSSVATTGRFPPGAEGAAAGERANNNNSNNAATPASSTAGSSSGSSSAERPTGRSRSSSRVSWTGGGSRPPLEPDDEDVGGGSPALGLAGPVSRRVEMSEESRAWVQSIKEKVRKASGSGAGGAGPAGGLDPVARFTREATPGTSTGVPAAAAAAAAGKKVDRGDAEEDPAGAGEAAANANANAGATAAKAKLDDSKFGVMGKVGATKRLFRKG